MYDSTIWHWLIQLFILAYIFGAGYTYGWVSNSLMFKNYPRYVILYGCIFWILPNTYAFLRKFYGAKLFIVRNGAERKP